MKRVLMLVLALVVLLVPTAAFAKSAAELSDVRRPVDAWLYNGEF